MLIVFSDLDGTLLDHSYQWEAAHDLLERLERRGVALVLATSKTRAEVEWWRPRLGNRHPFIVENGGAAFVPAHYFSSSAAAVLQFGDPYAEVVAALCTASQEAGVRVEGFHQWSDEEVAGRCGLPLEQARLARRREYDEPFVILDRAGVPRLLAAIARQRKCVTRGGRFHHISGRHDKGAAARALVQLYRREHGDVRTAGIGDAWNDLPLLEAVDVPILMPSAEAESLRRALPRLQMASGWSDGIARAIAL